MTSRSLSLCVGLLMTLAPMAAFAQTPDVESTGAAPESQDTALLIVRCEEAVELMFDDRFAVSCGAEIELAPGEYSVTASRVGFETHTAEVTLASGDTRELAMPALQEASPVESARGASSDSGNTLARDLLISGAVLTGVGVSAIIAALIVDGTVLVDKVDAYNESDRADADLASEIETLQDTNLALFSVGGVLGLGGVTLMLVSLAFEEDDPETLSLTNVRGWLGADGGGVGYQVRW